MRGRVSISIIGAGSLGSDAALLLASMRYQDIEVFDDDIVEYHNCFNQLYRKEDVGKPKVRVLKRLVSFLTGIKITPHFAKANKETRFAGNVVVVLVDSMEVRREIFAGVKYSPWIKLFIEARSGEHLARVYVVNPSDPDGVKRYEAEDILYLDEEATDAPCANENTLPTVKAISAAVAHFIRRWSEGWYPVCEESRIDFKDIPSIETEHLSL